MALERTTIRIPSKVKEEVGLWAIDENRSLNSQIIHILEKALEERKKKEAKK